MLSIVLNKLVGIMTSMVGYLEKVSVVITGISLDTQALQDDLDSLEKRLTDLTSK